MSASAEPTPAPDWLGQMLSVVRQLGAMTDLGDVLNHIASAVVDVLGFEAVAIQVDDGAGCLRVESVYGPPDTEAMLGQSLPVRAWREILSCADPRGELRVLDRRSDTITDLDRRLAPLVPAAVASAGQRAGTALLAPMYGPDRELLGVIGVSPAENGPSPSDEQCTLLALFAVEAGRAIVDTRERELADERNRTFESLWRLAFDSSPVGTCILDSDGFILEANPAVASMLYRSHDDLIGRHHTDYMWPDDRQTWVDGPFARLVEGDLDSFQIDVRYRTAFDDPIWASVHVGVIREKDGFPVSIVAQLMDITARKQAEALLTYRASHDPLTDLPNRATAESMLAAALRLSHSTGVLFCDLDRFKIINDTLGHDAGDEVLSRVVRRLRSAVPADCTLARVGGDEFVVVAPGMLDAKRLVALGDALRATLDEPFAVRGHHHTLSLSVGVTISQPWHQNPDEVLREADQAMLRAKRSGRSRVEMYDPQLDKITTIADLDLENDLRMALAEGRGLKPYFQPILSLASGRYVGAEALIRWHHPQRGLMDPSEFLDIADASGLIIPLGWWMLEVSCQALKRESADAGQLWVAVNTSGRQLGRGLLPSAVRRALDTYDLSRDRLRLELKERTMVDAGEDGLQELREVSDLGVTIVLDDYGTGYSSASVLRDVPIGMVKLDRSLITPLAAHDQPSVAVVRRVVDMCHDLSIMTAATGVESEDQFTLLRSLGCDFVQGYLIGAPEPFERFGAAAAARVRAEDLGLAT